MVVHKIPISSGPSKPSWVFWKSFLSLEKFASLNLLSKVKLLPHVLCLIVVLFFPLEASESNDEHLFASRLTRPGFQKVFKYFIWQNWWESYQKVLFFYGLETAVAYPFTFHIVLGYN